MQVDIFTQIVLRQGDDNKALRAERGPVCRLLGRDPSFDMQAKQDCPDRASADPQVYAQASKEERVIPKVTLRKCCKLSKQAINELLGKYMLVCSIHRHPTGSALNRWQVGGCCPYPPVSHLPPIRCGPRKQSKYRPFIFCSHC